MNEINALPGLLQFPKVGQVDFTLQNDIVPQIGDKINVSVGRPLFKIVSIDNSHPSKGKHRENHTWYRISYK